MDWERVGRKLVRTKASKACVVRTLGEQYAVETVLRESWLNRKIMLPNSLTCHWTQRTGILLCEVTNDAQIRKVLVSRILSPVY